MPAVLLFFNNWHDNFWLVFGRCFGDQAQCLSPLYFSIALFWVVFEKIGSDFGWLTLVLLTGTSFVNQDFASVCYLGLFLVIFGFGCCVGGQAHCLPPLYFTVAFFRV